RWEVRSSQLERAALAVEAEAGDAILLRDGVVDGQPRHVERRARTDFLADALGRLDAANGPARPRRDVHRRRSIASPAKRFRRAIRDGGLERATTCETSL